MQRGTKGARTICTCLIETGADGQLIGGTADPKNLVAGAHTIYARAAIDTNYSPVTSRSFTVSALSGNERVEWQVVANGAQPDPAYWRPANDVLQYSLEVNTSVHGKGTFQIYVRMMKGDAQVAITSVTAKFSGK